MESVEKNNQSIEITDKMINQLEYYLNKLWDYFFQLQNSWKPIQWLFLWENTKLIIEKSNITLTLTNENIEIVFSKTKWELNYTINDLKDMYPWYSNTILRYEFNSTTISYILYYKQKIPWIINFFEKLSTHENIKHLFQNTKNALIENFEK